MAFSLLLLLSDPHLPLPSSLFPLPSSLFPLPPVLLPSSPFPLSFPPFPLPSLFLLPLPQLAGIVYMSPRVAEIMLGLHTLPPLDACTYVGLDNGAQPLSVSENIQFLKSNTFILLSPCLHVQQLQYLTPHSFKCNSFTACSHNIFNSFTAH